jgi:Flp pilus assembly protein TadG
MKNRRSERGEVMLELALVTPALLLLCFGGIELSRAFRGASVTAAASRAGIHYASLSDAKANDTAGIVGAAKADADNDPDLDVSVSHCTCSVGGPEVSCTTSCANQSKYVKVTAAFPFEPVVKFPGLASVLTLNSVSHLRVK